jgi:hypothetical protein
MALRTVEHAMGEITGRYAIDVGPVRRVVEQAAAGGP